MKQLTMLSALLLSCGWATAQDQQFTQFYAVPTALNPAFAGASVQGRLATQYRHQWAAIPGGFRSFNLACDQYFHGIRSGLGVLLNHSTAGSGGLRTTSFNLQYAYEGRIKRNWFFRPALQFGYIGKSIDFDKLTFYDQMIRENAPSSVEQGLFQPVSFFDFGGGLLTYGPNFWLGVSAYHANTANEALYPTGTSPLYRKLSVHGGWRIRIRGNSLQKLDHHIVLAANYLTQQQFDQLDFGFYYEYNPVIFGLWYRGMPAKSNQLGYPNHDAVAILAGVQAGKYKIGYSYDITISTLGIGNSAGSHELTLSYQWSSKKSERLTRRRIMPCAKF